MSSGNRLLSDANQGAKATPLHGRPRPENEGSSRLELVGTIDSPGQTRTSMSWSSDGKYLATSTGKNVSVWRLPGKKLYPAHKNSDARSTKAKKEVTPKVSKE